MKHLLKTDSRRVCKKLFTALVIMVFMYSSQIKIQAQCNPSSGFTKITNSSGTVTYPGTNGSPAVTVTTTATGSVGMITFCGINNGFRAGVGDRSGSYRFAFSPAVNGIAINLNAVSNVTDDQEVVRIRINNALYTITAANITCSANCFGCSGEDIFASGGAIASVVSNTGNGTGQLLIQGAGLISSIEYVNEVQSDEPEGSVFELFFNNSTCLLPVMLSSFTATTSLAGIQLNWFAATEVSVSYYQLESSTDGLNFKTITRVPAKNGGNYQYTDITKEAGIIYYRLKIVDRDGSYAYSKIVTVTVLSAGNKIVVVNPISEVLTITGLGIGNTVSIYAMTGKKVAKIIAGRSMETINTVGWPAGMYIVKAMDNGKMITTEKVIKQ